MFVKGQLFKTQGTGHIGRICNPKIIQHAYLVEWLEQLDLAACVDDRAAIPLEPIEWLLYEVSHANN